MRAAASLLTACCRCYWLISLTAVPHRTQLQAAHTTLAALFSCDHCSGRHPFLAVTLTCCAALLLLQIFTKYLKKGVWDLKAIVDSGGMPSSHSALCAVSGVVSVLTLLLPTQSHAVLSSRFE